MRKQLMIPALLAMSVALAACSTPPNANLENARTNFSSLQTNPQATKLAALETKDASEWLDKADKAYRDKEDEKKVDQLAYLTHQRVVVAKDTIALRANEAKLKNGGKGTVGCVALDKNGKLAAATSTGGKGFEIVGRISDSATVAGNFANQYCAVSCTGVGEDIVSNATAAKIVTRVSDGMPIEKAFEKTFQELKEIDGFAGAIAINQSGNFFHQDSYPTMVFASFDGINFEVFD